MTGVSLASFQDYILRDTGWSNRQGVYRCSTGNSLSLVSAVKKRGAADTRIVCGSLFNMSDPLLTRMQIANNVSISRHQGKPPITFSKNSLL